jgi:plasmid stabilization system protein ParE
LRFSPAAERDLEEIADYIAQDNPQRALSFVVELRQTAAEL